MCSPPIAQHALIARSPCPAAAPNSELLALFAMSPVDASWPLSSLSDSPSSSGASERHATPKRGSLLSRHARSTTADCSPCSRHSDAFTAFRARWRPLGHSSSSASSRRISRTSDGYGFAGSSAKLSSFCTHSVSLRSTSLSRMCALSVRRRTAAYDWSPSSGSGVGVFDFDGDRGSPTTARRAPRRRAAARCPRGRRCAAPPRRAPPSSCPPSARWSRGGRTWERGGLAQFSSADVGAAASV